MYVGLKEAELTFLICLVGGDNLEFDLFDSGCRFPSLNVFLEPCVIGVGQTRPLPLAGSGYNLRYQGCETSCLNELLVVTHHTHGGLFERSA